MGECTLFKRARSGAKGDWGIPPDLHAKLTIAAQLKGNSLNHYITEALQRFVV